MTDINFLQHKQKKDMLAKLIAKNPCPRCRNARLPQCVCEAIIEGAACFKTECEEIEETQCLAAQTTAAAEQTDIALDTQLSTPKKTKQTTGEPHTAGSETTQFESVSNLASLILDNIRSVLTLKAKPSLNKEEWELLHNFLYAIQCVFNDFIFQLRQHGIPIKDFVSTLKDNVLVISFAKDPHRYDQFLQLLAGKKMLPRPMLRQQSSKREEEIEALNTKQPIRPTPFSLRLTKDKK